MAEAAVSPHVPNGPYCPGVTHTLAFGYLLAKAFIGAACSWLGLGLGFRVKVKG